MTEEDPPKPDCIGGATGYIDRWILGVDHMYQWTTASEVYHSGVFDPEGVLGRNNILFLSNKIITKC